MDTLEIEKTEIKLNKKVKISNDTAIRAFELDKELKNLKAKRLEEIGTLADKLGVLFFDIQDLAGAFILLKEAHEANDKLTIEQKELVKHIKSLGDNFRKNPSKYI